MINLRRRLVPSHAMFAFLSFAGVATLIYPHSSKVASGTVQGYSPTYENIQTQSLRTTSAPLAVVSNGVDHETHADPSEPVQSGRPPFFKTDSSSKMPDGCAFAEKFDRIWNSTDAASLLQVFDQHGGADSNRRKRFMQDFFSTLNSFKVHYWLEEGTLLQTMRNMSSIPGEPAFMPFDDIDIGIRDVELASDGGLARSMETLREQGFKVIRCGRQVFSLERDGDYVDVMIFASDLPNCSVREPNLRVGCSPGITPYVMHVHGRPFGFLEGISVSLPGSSLLETTEYLKGMFGVNWREHDNPNWRTAIRGASTRGKSVDWAMTDRSLASKVDRFILDPLGEVPAERLCPYTFQSVLAEGKRLVRIDDYPFPTSKTPISVQRVWLEHAINILENASVPYLLGVSPHRLAFDDLHEHVAFLNNIVKNGYICMHGFTHRTNASTDEIDVHLWAKGGEFAKYDHISELEREWVRGDTILQNINRYTREHFIPPFNAITQDMVDVVTSRGTRFIHSFDHALRVREGRNDHPAFGPPFGGYLEDFALPENAVFVVSEWVKTYAHASEVTVEPHGSQICLHWYYDAKNPEYPNAYRQLALKLTA